MSGDAPLVRALIKVMEHTLPNIDGKINLLVDWKEPQRHHWTFKPRQTAHIAGIGDIEARRASVLGGLAGHCVRVRRGHCGGCVVAGEVALPLAAPPLPVLLLAVGAGAKVRRPLRLAVDVPLAHVAAVHPVRGGGVGRARRLVQAVTIQVRDRKHYLPRIPNKRAQNVVSKPIIGSSLIPFRGA